MSKSYKAVNAVVYRCEECGEIAFTEFEMQHHIGTKHGVN